MFEAREKGRRTGMRTATGLLLIALGAVFAFAVHGHPWFLNLQVCGWILMIVGVIGMVIPRSGYGWLRRQMVTRRGPDGRPVLAVRQKRYPPYIMVNPAAVPTADGGEAADMPEMPASSDAASWAGAETTVIPDKETVEEFFQE
jgi:hypothetical protein